MSSPIADVILSKKGHGIGVIFRRQELRTLGDIRQYSRMSLDLAILIGESSPVRYRLRAIFAAKDLVLFISYRIFTTAKLQKDFKFKLI